MAANQSDSELTITAPSKGSIMREVQGMYEVIKEERGDENTTIIAVVRPESLVELKRKCKKQRWKIWKDNSAVLVTSDDWLQATIDEVNQVNLCRRLTLLVSGEVGEISFDVQSHIHILKILCCGDLDANRQLLINGSSTFNRVRLDKWQERHRTRSIYLGAGVRIKVELNSTSSWARSANKLDDKQQAELRCQLPRHFHRMKNTSGKGAWDEWKGPVAAILGLIVGAGKMACSMKAAAGGIYVKYMFAGYSLEVAAAGAKVSVVAATAGSAILLGVGVAVTVYYIPWDSVINWLKGVINWLWQGIEAICDMFQSCLARFYSCVESIFGNDVTEEKEYFRSRPMGFSG